MAEIAVIAGISVTIPGVLRGAWAILKAAYDLYGSVDNRKEAVKALLDRCGELMKKVAEDLHLHPDSSRTLSNSVASLESTFASVKSIIETLGQKGFLWILMHPDRIDRQIQAAGVKIADAFMLFNTVAHLDHARFMAEVEKARRSDQAALSIQLRSLSNNDMSILQAVRDVNGVNRRMEEVLIAIYKHVESLPASPFAQSTSPEDEFLRSAAGALRRASDPRDQSLQVLAPWVVSSLEVEFEKADIIGEGSFGRIFKGEWNGAIVAIKQMYKQDATLLTADDRKAMRGEVRIWSQLQHPNVLSLFGACPEAEFPFLLMRYCQFGNVLQYLKKHPDAVRATLSYDISAGLSFLHSKRIIHADLKGVNVLVGDDHHALLTDFGLSLMLDDVRSRSTATYAGPTRGTLRWMAPECLNGHRADESSDLYSLGVTIWELYSEEIPLAGFKESLIPFQVEMKKKRPERPPNLDQDVIWELIQHCWAHDASQRPKVDTVRQSLKPYTSYAGPDESALSSPPSLLQRVREGNSETTFGALALSEPTSKPRNAADTQAWTAWSTPERPSSGQAPNSLRILARPWTQSEWSEVLRSNPPRWQRGNPNVYLDSVTFPVVPTKKAYKYRLIKGSKDLGVRPTYALNVDGSQTVNFLEYNGGYGINHATLIKLIAVDPEGQEVLVAMSDWSSYLYSHPPQWRRGHPNHFIDGVTFPRTPTHKAYRYRVIKGVDDLGIHPTPPPDAGRSQTINFVEYTDGPGIPDSVPVSIFAVDPEGHEEFVAAWDATPPITELPLPILGAAKSTPSVAHSHSQADSSQPFLPPLNPPSSTTTTLSSESPPPLNPTKNSERRWFEKRLNWRK